MNNTMAESLICDRIKYVDDECVLRYDNEAGKGDHRYRNDNETTCTFVGLPQLLSDFMSDVARWNDENRTL